MEAVAQMEADQEAVEVEQFEHGICTGPSCHTADKCMLGWGDDEDCELSDDEDDDENEFENEDGELDLGKILAFLELE